MNEERFEILGREAFKLASAFDVTLGRCISQLRHGVFGDPTFEVFLMA
jgi:hypothetical protein